MTTTDDMRHRSGSSSQSGQNASAKMSEETGKVPGRSGKVCKRLVEARILQYLCVLMSSQETFGVKFSIRYPLEYIAFSWGARVATCPNSMLQATARTHMER